MAVEMDYQSTTEMAEALVREHSSASYIRSLIIERFGKSPTIKKIAAMRGAYLRSQPDYRRSSHNCRPIPTDFADKARVMTKAELQKHYGVRWNGTIDRWLKDVGVQAKQYIPKANPIHAMGRPKPSFQVTKQKDDYEVAADTLRRQRFLVNRCNQDGSYNLTGLYWRVGRNVITASELIQKASRYECQSSYRDISYR